MADSAGEKVILRTNNLPPVLERILVFVDRAIPEIDKITTSTDNPSQESVSDVNHEQGDTQGILVKRWDNFCTTVDKHTQTLCDELGQILDDDKNSRRSTPSLSDSLQVSSMFDHETLTTNAAATKIKTKIVEAMLARLQIESV